MSPFIEEIKKKFRRVILNSTSTMNDVGKKEPTTDNFWGFSPSSIDFK